MGAHSDFVAFLKGHQTITAAARGGVFHEFFPEDQKMFPVLLYRLVSWTEAEPDMDYPDGEALNERRFQLDIVGESSISVTDTQDAVDHVLVNFSGPMGSLNIQQIRRSTASDLGEIRGDKQRRHASADYIIWYD